MEYKNLLVEIENGIAVIYINRPASLNALNPETIDELGGCLAAIEADDAVKVIILTGSGSKSFVAGADIVHMVNISGAEGRAFSLQAIEVFGRLENMPKPTIAAVNGFALGGGCEISMACDITIASDNARFGQPEVGLGILPGFGGTQRLPRLIGKKRAKELIFTGDLISAEEAYQLGIVNHVVPQAELLDYCKAMAGRIMKNAPLAVGMAKQVINTGMDVDLNSGLMLEASTNGVLFDTEDKKIGMTAFVEKKKEKNFVGR